MVQSTYRTSLEYINWVLQIYSLQWEQEIKLVRFIKLFLDGTGQLPRRIFIIVVNFGWFWSWFLVEFKIVKLDSSKLYILVIKVETQNESEDREGQVVEQIDSPEINVYPLWQG